MRVLIAEDDPVSSRMLHHSLENWGYHVEAVPDGVSAWQALRRDDAPPLAILNWMMPGMDGPKICRKVRESLGPRAVYIILLTARNRVEDVVDGLLAGADDYVAKPFDAEELRARVQVGERIVGLQSQLTERVIQLENAMSQVKRLQGLLPICSYCKKIRDDKDYWQAVDTYIASHSDAYFGHSICPDCHDQYIKPLIGERLDPSK